MRDRISVKDKGFSDAIIWHVGRNIQSIKSTGPGFYCMGEYRNPFLNSSSFACKSAFNLRNQTSWSDESDKEFLKFESVFLQQVDKSKLQFLAPLTEIKFRFSLALSEILKLDPDTLTLELTSERSIYYTFIKRDYSIFIQHYIDSIDLDDDEIILTAFKGTNKLPSYAGKLAIVIAELREIIYPKSELKSWLPSYELSC